MSLPLLLVTLLFGVLGLYLLGSGISDVSKARRAASWPTVAAELEHVELKQERDSDGTDYRAEVRYTYRVQGQVYTGDTISFGYAATNHPQAHQALVDKLKSARQVQARYNPERPEESCLVDGVTRSHLFRLVFALSLLVFLAGFNAVWWLSEQGEARLIDGIVVLRRGG